MQIIPKEVIRNTIGFWTGVLLFVLMLALPAPEGMSGAAQRTAAVTILMVCWWISEAAPIGVTALVPLALYPLLGVLNSKETAAPYADHNVFLFLGGFCLANAVERWNLHRRIALRIMRLAGTKPSRLILGCMVATAGLSMWISNTATTVMMLPIALALVQHFSGTHNDKVVNRFAAALLLAIAYSASIGGIGTLIGTPPNLVLAGQLKKLFPEAPEIGFFQWMTVGVPFVVVFLPVAWVFLTRVAFRLPPDLINAQAQSVLRAEAEKLGPMCKGEKCVLIVFVLTACAWMTRQSLQIGEVTILGWADLIGISEYAHDSTVAIASAILLFIIPIKGAGNEPSWQPLLPAGALRQLPWDILLLFGGGFAMAEAFRTTGLSEWIGQSVFQGVATWPGLLLVVMSCLLAMLLTEFASNTAATAVLIPIVAASAVSLQVDPRLLMIPAAISASCAFVLPVATPPNAIVFGTGKLTIPMMAKAGIALNFIGVILITALVYLLAVQVFAISLGQPPPWAN